MVRGGKQKKAVQMWEQGPKKEKINNDEDEIETIIRDASFKDGRVVLSHMDLSHGRAITLARLIKDPKCRITKLCLQWCKIWSDEALVIFSALLENNTIEHLDMGHNSIGNRGASCMSECLRSNKKLSVVYLNDNEITDEGAMDIISNLSKSNVKNLNLTGNPISSSIVTEIQLMLDSNKNNANVNNCKTNQPPLSLDSNTQFTAELLAIKEQNQILTKEMGKKNKEISQSKKLIGNLQKQIQEKSKQIKELSEADLSRTREVEEMKTALISYEKNDGRRELDVKINNLKFENENYAKLVNALEHGRVDLMKKQQQLETKLLRYNPTTFEFNNLDINEIDELEDELESTIKKLRQAKVKKITRKNEELIELRRCKVCFEGVVNTLLFPCAHLVLCQVCSDKLQKCPMCSVGITSRVRVFEG